MFVKQMIVDTTKFGININYRAIIGAIGKRTSEITNETRYAKQNEVVVRAL